ncbi:L-selectin-like isoform X2 [Clupea harengus]|uniref:E-selectin n=1 Tax=Clupea harengus TaxID=7950 RepID=A0A6P8FRI4_CLUHA|nr:L-selectin-like isoform X2 [Clupea harengus]
MTWAHYKKLLRRGTSILSPLKPLLLLVTLSLPGPGCVFCWTYSSSADNMTWTEARNFCRTNYTDLVAIQNTDETEHLLNITHIIPHRVSTPHYWIGIRKIKGTWTWVGMNKSMTGNGSWAPNEPNSVDGEDCVEIYINQENKKGKWNDINCAKKNFAICYKAQCTSDACYGQGECVETINSFQCLCHLGFGGSHCQIAVQCRKPIAPQNGWTKCCGGYGNHSFGTTCTFSCQDGFRMEGPGEITCNSTGEWSEREPECSAPSCDVLIDPVGGLVNCSGATNTFHTTCTFQCHPGFLLLGSTEVTCEANGTWSGFRPVCASYTHLLMAVLVWNVLSAACCFTYWCQSCHRRKKYHQAGSQHDRLNPVYDATGPLEEPFST